MIPTPPTILLTRPQAQSLELAARLRPRVGEEVPILVSPILEIVPVPFHVTVQPGFVVLTSAHAASAAGKAAELSGLPAFCVGDRTAEAAHLAGFTAVSGGGAATDLAALIERMRPSGPGLYLRGRHAAADLEETLTSAGIETHSVIAYDQRPLPLSAEARAVITGNATPILPVYSPRSSRLLAAECADAEAQPDVVAISPQAAQPWLGLHAKVFVAPAPDGQSMEDMITERARARSAC